MHNPRRETVTLAQARCPPKADGHPPRTHLGAKDVSAEDSRHVMESVNHTLEAFNNGLEAFTSSRSEDMAQLRELVKEGADDLRPFIKTTAEVGPIHVKECQEAMRRSQEAVEKTVQRVVEQTAERVAEQAEKVDLAPVLEAIRRCRASVDLSPTCQDGVVQSVRDEIQKIRTKVDFTPVLQACREIKPEVDLAAVLAAIREAKPEPVDFGPVLEAIQVSDDKVYDFRRQVSDDRVSADKAIREGLQDLRTSVDFAPVFDCVDRLKTALDLRQVGTAEFIATVREEMHKIKTAARFRPGQAGEAPAEGQARGIGQGAGAASRPAGRPAAFHPIPEPWILRPVKSWERLRAVMTFESLIDG